MAKLNHNWPRFWFHLGKPVQLDGRGVLLDPENEHAHFYYVDYPARLLNQLVELPVTILLGEPGIIGDPTMVKPGTPYKIQRSWKERLFARPWLPMKKMRIVVPLVPLDHAIKMPGGYS